MPMKVKVESPKLKYFDEFIEAEYDYQTTKIISQDRECCTVSYFF